MGMIRCAQIGGRELLICGLFGLLSIDEPLSYAWVDASGVLALYLVWKSDILP